MSLLITKEEVLALREELSYLLDCHLNSNEIDSIIVKVLTKVCSEKLMAEYELERFYSTCSRSPSDIMTSYSWQDKHGALLLQAPEFMKLFYQKDSISEQIERMADTYLNPPKAEEL